MKSCQLYNESVPSAVKKVYSNSNRYIFEYPCESNHICTDYQILLSRSKYIFQLYGASGGSPNNKSSSYRFDNNSCIDDSIVRRYSGNTNCERTPNNGGAGGYISGTIILHSDTFTFLTIGGKGIFGYKFQERSTNRCFNEYRNRGGYGGGGSSENWYNNDNQYIGTGSGGGQTAVKFLKNNLWHRVLVSGGGGGTDDDCGQYGMSEDGSGGAGGNLAAQSWFLEGTLKHEYFANSTNGFTFGTGEAARFGPNKNPKSVPNGEKMITQVPDLVGLVDFHHRTEQVVQVVGVRGHYHVMLSSQKVIFKQQTNFMIILNLIHMHSLRHPAIYSQM